MGFLRLIEGSPLPEGTLGDREPPLASNFEVKRLSGRRGYMTCLIPEVGGNQESQTVSIKKASPLIARLDFNCELFNISHPRLILRGILRCYKDHTGNG